MFIKSEYLSIGVFQLGYLFDHQFSFAGSFQYYDYKTDVSSLDPRSDYDKIVVISTLQGIRKSSCFDALWEQLKLVPLSAMTGFFIGILNTDSAKNISSDEEMRIASNKLVQSSMNKAIIHALGIIWLETNTEEAQLHNLDFYMHENKRVYNIELETLKNGDNAFNTALDIAQDLDTMSEMKTRLEIEIRYKKLPPLQDEKLEFERAGSLRFLLDEGNFSEAQKFVETCETTNQWLSDFVQTDVDEPIIPSNSFISDSEILRPTGFISDDRLLR